MKRHRRDEHGIKSGSTSPPMKSKKKSAVNEEEPMNIENGSDNDDDKVGDLSLKLEDMDIDVPNTDEQDEIKQE